jgi:hypothetical protein
VFELRTSSRRLYDIPSRNLIDAIPSSDDVGRRSYAHYFDFSSVIFLVAIVFWMNAVTCYFYSATHPGGDRDMAWIFAALATVPFVASIVTALCGCSISTPPGSIRERMRGSSRMLRQRFDAPICQMDALVALRERR